jgi:hypothetical protein
MLNPFLITTPFCSLVFWALLALPIMAAAIKRMLAFMVFVFLMKQNSSFLKGWDDNKR